MELDTIICGDALEVLRGMPADNVNCCVTSPPYWGLRDYGTAKWEGGDPECDHALPNDAPNSKKMTVGQMSSHAGRFSGDCRRCGAHRIDSQLGLEKTPEEYVAKMVEVFREVRRVLTPEGTFWLNLGDSFASGKGTCYNPGGGETSLGRERKETGAHPLDRGNKSTLEAAGLKPKDLVGVPWRVAFALQADGWYLRSDIIWSKCNPMPESVTDRPTKSHEYLFLLSKSHKYYWDQEAVKEQSICGDPRRPYAPGQVDARGNGHDRGRGKIRASVLRGGFDGKTNVMPGREAFRAITNSRNIRSVWTIATQPFKGAHFATFPEKLVVPCIKAGCPAEVCPKCGKARERIVKTGALVPDAPGYKPRGTKRGDAFVKNAMTPAGATQGHPNFHHERETTGWTDCGCGAGFTSGVVLDPFFGAGTVGVVAKKLGRRYIGIDLSPDYCAMARKRIAEVPPNLFPFPA